MFVFDKWIKKTGLFSFGVFVLLVVAMALATWYEHLHGSAQAGVAFYNGAWFALLWLVVAATGLYYITEKALQKRLWVFLLHVSFLLILLGALTTRLTGKTGHVHLRENHHIEGFLDEWTHSAVKFPFSISLKSFKVEYYSGTASPANYVSIVEVTDTKSGEKFEQEISMNNILRYKGYRFYQSSFDDDWLGSVLSVNHDTWGIPITYAGYYLMFFSMLMVLFDKRERFRCLIKKLSQKTALVVVLLSITCIADANSADSYTVSKETASRLGRLRVDYQGRISPVQTLANDFTAKLTGKTNYKNYSGEQVFFGWLFYYQQWRQIPIFELKSPELKRIAGVNEDYASLSDFVDINGRNILEPYFNIMYSSNNPKGWIKEAVKLNDKFHLIDMLRYGNLLKIFPMYNEDGKLMWYTPNVEIPAQTDSLENVFTQHFFPFIHEALISGDNDAAHLHIDNMVALQQKKANDYMPSDTRLNVEILYNRLKIFSLLFKICLTIGALSLLFFIYKDSKSGSRKIVALIQKKFHLALYIVFFVAAIGLLLRTYIGGRFPMSNTYETMLLLALIILLTGILLRNYSTIIVVFSFLLAGFTLLVAHIGSINPQITPLAPVLVSPLLNIHVLTIMVAYGLCGFMALNSVTSFIVRIFGGKNIDKTTFLKQMKETSEMLMFPATFLMGAGIFIGAIWANMSWGRYWGWDPKEVWALITFMLMSLTFHEKTLRWLRKPLFYHIFVLIIFLSVLMTYFGVNYILGGKHSYAG